MSNRSLSLSSSSSLTPQCVLPSCHSYAATPICPRATTGLASVAGCQSPCSSNEPSSNLAVHPGNRFAIDRVWLPDTASLPRLINEALSPMEQHLALVSEWSTSVMVAMAVSWLLWRTSQVLMKPAEELIHLLGLDVPVAPSLSLAGLKADGFLIRWDSLDQKPARRYNLVINGITVAEISPADSSLQIAGLQPNHGYIIRIVAVSSVGFTDPSPPLSIQTKAETSGDFFSAPDRKTNSLENSLAGVSVRPYQALTEQSTASNTAIPMQREHSGSISQQQKRNASGRRHTQNSHTPQDQTTDSAPKETESEAAIKGLSDRAEKLHLEIEQNEAQSPIEELKFREDHDNLTKALQDVQLQLQTRNNDTKKLNQHVATLVTEESIARKDKATLDKQLGKVSQERQRMADDMTKWVAESSKIEDQIHQLSVDQEDYEKNARNQVSQLKASFADEKAKNDAMEEGIKTTIARIKQWEEEIKQLEGNVEVDGSSQSTVFEEQAWNRQLIELQHRCNNLVHQQQQVKAALINDQALLDMWRQYYLDQTQAYQAAQLDESSRENGQHGERRASLSGFDNGNIPNAFGISPVFPSLGPLFNISNGTMRFSDRLVSPTTAETNSNTDITSYADADLEHSEAAAEPDLKTDEVPTSPSAMNEFLPSDLLIRDDFDTRYGAIGQRIRMGREPSQNNNILPGLGAPETLEDHFPGPSSPISLQSRSPSVFTSPRASNINLPGSGSLGDADKRSIKSTTGSARAVSGGVSGTKFASIFRPRNKGTSDQGPALGSLRSDESQSMPRPVEDDDIPEESTASSRRRGSHSGPSWMGQMLGRANTSHSMEDSRKKKFTTLFAGAKKIDPWADSRDSPRPGSTNSVETHGLPRPSAESVSRFGWSSSGDFSSSQLNNSFTSTDWRRGTAQSSWGANLHSRNTSMQHGHAYDGTFDNPKAFSGLAQAPIGTRPRTPNTADSRPQTSTTPLRLNPNAPTFTGFFGKKGEEIPHGDAPVDWSGHHSTFELLPEDGRSSPFESRKSRDGNSLLSAEYASDARDSLDHSMSSAAPSESGAAPKESFMRKLTRKSSAGFTSLAGRRGPGSKKPSAALLAAAAARDEAMDGGQDQDEMSRSTATIGEDTPKDKSTLSPLVGSGGSVRGFSLRSLRRKKGDRNGSVEGDDDDLDTKA